MVANILEMTEGYGNSIPLINNNLKATSLVKPILVKYNMKLPPPILNGNNFHCLFPISRFSPTRHLYLGKKLTLVALRPALEKQSHCCRRLSI